MRDFKLITELNNKIAELLESRPEYKEWWEEVQIELSKADAKNRLAFAEDLMMRKFKEMTEALENAIKEIRK